ncbi:hypothetical protein TNCV_1430101 [Trichonephila clavipes]|nr:hypothetical protein TNCV_1430101 [Trichonephila clavipes]
MLKSINHGEKSNSIRAGDHGGHRTGSPRLMQWSEYVISSQSHRNVLEPHYASPFLHPHLLHFSRKPWIVQVQFFRQFLSTPNEEFGCDEFRCCLWDTLYSLYHKIMCMVS